MKNKIIILFVFFFTHCGKMKNNSFMMNYTNEKKLKSAIKENDLNKMKNIRKNSKLDFNYKDEYGNTFLHIACLNYKPDDITNYLYNKRICKICDYLIDECQIFIDTLNKYNETPFFEILQYNRRLKLLKYLQKKGAKLNLECKDKNYTIAFLKAARFADLETLKYLYEQNANVYAKDIRGFNALHLATSDSNNGFKKIKWLLEKFDFNIDCKGGDAKLTPFLCATNNSSAHKNILKYLKKEGAHIRAVDRNGNNALHLACKRARFDRFYNIKWIYKNCDLKINSRNNYGAIPLIFALDTCSLDAKYYLIKQGSNINPEIISYFIRTCSSPEILNLSLKKSNINFKSEDTLSKILFNKHNHKILVMNEIFQHEQFLYSNRSLDATRVLELLKYFKKKGINFSKVYEGIILIRICKILPDIEIIKFLIEKCKVNVNSRDDGKYDDTNPLQYDDTNPLLVTTNPIDNRGMTPFLILAKKDNLESLTYLKQRGANYSVCNYKNENALHLTRNAEIIKYLVQGLNFNIEQKGGTLQKTPILYNATNPGIIKYFINKNANINATDIKGNNILHLSLDYFISKSFNTFINGGGKGTIEFLLNYIDINSKNKNGKTPFLRALGRSVEWPKGISPQGSHKTGREILTSSGFYHPIYKCVKFSQWANSLGFFSLILFRRLYPFPIWAFNFLFLFNNHFTNLLSNLLNVFVNSYLLYFP